LCVPRFVLQITFPVFVSSSPLRTIAPHGFYLNSLVMTMPVKCFAQLNKSVIL